MNARIVQRWVGGIYGIKCTANDKIYVGSSTHIRQRLVKHRCDLRNKKHCNQHLQNSFDLYGEDSFSFVVLEEVSDTDLLTSKENYYISLYNSTERKNGFNLITETERRTHSEESKEKMSIAQKGKKMSPKTKERMKAVWTEERKKEMADLHRGREVSQETRLKLSERRKGIKRSPEERAKMKEAWTDERKKLISQKLTGRKRSPESIQKLKFHISRPILKMSLVGEILERFESIKSAADQYGNTFGIGNSCKDGKPRFGFKWMYASSKLP